MADPLSVKAIDYTVDAGNIEDGALHILKQIRPSWPQKSVCFRVSIVLKPIAFTLKKEKSLRQSLNVYTVYSCESVLNRAIIIQNR